MQSWGLTDPGCVRPQNQDAYQIEQLDRNTLLCVVCDGMGGAKSGNIASTLAVDVFTQEVKRTWSASMNADKIDQMLRGAVKLANFTVFDQAAQFEEFTGMGTTLTAVLIKGKKVWGVASDDGHGLHHFCHAWVMVNSENNVDAILAALKEGAFYSSCGPVIKDFYVEDGVAHVECSEASFIEFISDRHPTKMLRGENLTSGEISLDGGWAGGYDYIRVSVVDAEGRRAWTNPIWLE